MNWKNGLFRTWVLISVLWLILIAFRAYNEFSVPHLFSGNFQYVIQLIEASEKQPDFSKGFYEIANAPDAQGWAQALTALGAFSQGVQNGEAQRYKVCGSKRYRLIPRCLTSLHKLGGSMKQLPRSP